MPRIVYPIFSSGAIQGGHKMIIRHVETLRDLGFNAVCFVGPGGKTPDWLSHTAPLISGEPTKSDDILVVPDDAPKTLANFSTHDRRVVIFLQNLYACSVSGMSSIDLYPKSNFPAVIGVGPRVAADFARVYPEARVEIVPCFADDRIFKPSPDKRQAIAFAPRKRPLEAAAILNLFTRLHPRHAEIPLSAIENMPEVKAAEIFAKSSLFLSLNRLESVGMTALEAMASGCLCAGFTGVGGDEYATAENGFWVPNEDCVAAADALAEAADVVCTGGPALRARLDAGFETARRWSYAAFRQSLEETWMRLAPEARGSAGPLDAPLTSSA